MLSDQTSSILERGTGSLGVGFWSSRGVCAVSGVAVGGLSPATERQANTRAQQAADTRKQLRFMAAFHTPLLPWGIDVPLCVQSLMSEPHLVKRPSAAHHHPRLEPHAYGYCALDTIRSMGYERLMRDYLLPL